ncbi:MAG: hypothetical protein Q8P50_07345 [Bacillota bacterium]|nr:hypothetical protein [Bacillota bacterium]
MGHAAVVASLCAQIAQERAARLAARVGLRRLVEELKTEAGTTLEMWFQTRKRSVADVRKAANRVLSERRLGVRRFLSDHRSRRSKAARVLRTALGRQTSERTIAVSSTLDRYRSERRRTSRATRQAAAEYREALRSSSNARLMAFSQDRVLAVGSWSKLASAFARTAKPPAAKKPSPIKSQPPQPNHVDDDTETHTQRVLEFIGNHPEGIVLVDMEAELGLPRIRVGNITRDLSKRGLVRKEDRFYYPAERQPQERNEAH